MFNTELPVEDREKWETFISMQLADTNKRNTVDLVSNFVNVCANEQQSSAIMKVLFCSIKLSSYSRFPFENTEPH